MKLSETVNGRPPSAGVTAIAPSPSTAVPPPSSPKTGNRSWPGSPSALTRLYRPAATNGRAKSWSVRSGVNVQFSRALSESVAWSSSANT